MLFNLFKSKKNKRKNNIPQPTNTQQQPSAQQQPNTGDNVIQSTQPKEEESKSGISAASF